jgi:hypothetical protein
MERAFAVLALLLAAAQAEAKKDPVNLVPRIDADLDSVAGDWAVVDGKLFSPKRARPPRMHLLQLPYVPPEEYDLTLEVESKGPFDPKGDTTSLDIGLPVGDVRPGIILDGWDGTVRGISDIDRKNASENETGSKGRIFTDGMRRTPVCSVRKTGITVIVDGRGRALEHAWPLDLSLAFPGAALSMPASLPEDDRARPASWPTKGHKGDRLDNSLQNRDEREVVIASKASSEKTPPDPLAGVGEALPLEREGSAVTHFDPKAGLPVKARGSLAAGVKGSFRTSIEFETAFTKVK